MDLSIEHDNFFRRQIVICSFFIISHESREKQQRFALLFIEVFIERFPVPLKCFLSDSRNFQIFIRLRDDFLCNFHCLLPQLQLLPSLPLPSLLGSSLVIHSVVKYSSGERFPLSGFQVQSVSSSVYDDYFHKDFPIEKVCSFVSFISLLLLGVSKLGRK